MSHVQVNAVDANPLNQVAVGTSSVAKLLTLLMGHGTTTGGGSNGSGGSNGGGGSSGSGGSSGISDSSDNGNSDNSDNSGRKYGSY